MPMTDCSPKFKLILLDIEGTTLPISFVQQILFPYASARLANFVVSNRGCPDVQAILKAVDARATGMPALEQLLQWAREDKKEAPLKLLQGLIWAEGFKAHAFETPVYADVAPTLHAWSHAGYRLAVYSSGSQKAQQLLYRHTDGGDMTALFEAFYDLSFGSKHVAASYVAIAKEAKLLTRDVLFLSDSPLELAAASEAGCAVCHVAREADKTRPAAGFKSAATLREVDALLAHGDLQCP